MKIRSRIIPFNKFFTKSVVYSSAKAILQITFTFIAIKLTPDFLCIKDLFPDFQFSSLFLARLVVSI